MIVNALDLDSDGDGVEDANESWTLDHDGDGVVNALDNDSDGDGVLDGVDPSYTRASVTYVGLTMYAGVDIGTWEPTNAGGDGETFVVISSLPDGLSFDATSGNITGAPTSNQSETTHTVWTNNTGGSNSTSISITVIEPTPSITASVASVVMNVNVNISAITWPMLRCAWSSWEVHPALPTGLTLDGFTGSIRAPSRQARQYGVHDLRQQFEWIEHSECDALNPYATRSVRERCHPHHHEWHRVHVDALEQRWGRNDVVLGDGTCGIRRSLEVR